MLEGIKSKLGFGGDNRGQQDEYYDDYDAGYSDEYGDEYDDGYDDYSDYGSDDYRDDASPRRSSALDSSLYGTRSRSSREISAPRLVSMEDVRARTQIPDSLKRDPLPPRRSSSASGYSSYRGERTTVDSSLPAVLTPEGAAAVSAAASAPRSTRSEGLNSLFEPSAPASSESQAREVRSSSYDPYEAYAGSTSSAYSSSRSLTVLKPVSYGEVERVAKTLKAGDAVVLCLRNTPDDLAKRILDFSFGVSAALDASVECPGEKVFALVRGKALTDAERMSLRNQGVL